MKQFINSLLVLVFVLGGALACKADLTGPLQVCSNVNNTYSYADDIQYTTQVWSVYAGSGTITGTGNGNRTIKQTTDITIRIQLKNGTVVVQTNYYDIVIKTPGTISPSAGMVCPGTSITITNSGRIGNSATWYTSPQGLNSWSAFGSGGLSVNYTINQNTDFKLVLNDCSTETSVLTVLLYYATTGGSISGSATICYGSTPGAFSNTSSPTGTNLSYQWQQNTGSGWTNVSGATGLTYAPGALYQNTDFRRHTTGCVGQADSNTITVTVHSLSIGGTLSVTSGGSICGSGTVNLSLSGRNGTVSNWYYRYNDGGGWSGWTSFSTANTSTNSISVTTNSSTNRSYEYYATVVNGVCPTVNSSTASSTVNVNKPGTLSSTLTEAYGSGSGTITLSNYVGSVVRWEFYPSNGAWAWITNTTNSNSFSNVTQNSVYHAVISNGACASNSPDLTVSIYPIPTIGLAASAPAAIPIGGSTQLVTSSGYYSVQWIKNGVDISGATATTLTVTAPASYSVRVKQTSNSISYTSGGFQVYPISGQLAIANALTTTNFRKSGITESSDTYALLATEYSQNISYMDGLGRTTQNIAIGMSPTRKDLVRPVRYNKYGETDTTYLAYADNLLSGVFNSNATRTTALPSSYTASEQYLFYQQTNAKTPGDTKPYGFAAMEAGPLGRATNQYSPGAAWQADTIKNVRQKYRVNTAADNVRRWTDTGPDVTTYYAAGALYKTQTIDENSNQVMTFTDKLGRTVLKRVQLSDSINSVVVTWLETYYAYDLRGNLALQIPPKATSLINGGTTWTTTFRDTWCFVYTYDDRNRLAEKKTPDAVPIYYCYDPLNRLVLVQDGNLRTNPNGTARNQWLFMKYDIQGRPIMTGIYTNTTYTTRPTMQASVLDPLYATGVWYEDKGSAWHGYTNQSFPMANVPPANPSLEIYTVNYYDNYDFDFASGDDFTYTAQGLTGEGTQGNSFGLPTGSKKLILGTSNWLFTYVFYDKYGRTIQARTNNHLSATVDNLATSVYDFEGKVTIAKLYHNAGGANQTTVINKYTYDAGGRLIKIYQNNNSAPSDQIVAQYEYNELGQVVDKKLHDTGSGNFLQSVDYRYNIRGWLASINNSQLNVNTANNDETNDYFGMELLYNTVESGLSNTAYYNGNISATKWKSIGGTADAGDQRAYKLTYDKSDKLKTATFRSYGTNAWDKEPGTLNENMKYDHNGNITTLKRYQNLRSLSGINVMSAPQAIDNLTYTYATGNQLSKVEDATSLATGFNNGVNTTTEYTYTTYGSLSKDDNKGIFSITYNALGKAQVITYSGAPAKTVTYIYDATGTKLKMVVYDGTTTTTTDYVGGFVYVNTALSFFGSPEGRVVKNGSNLEYQYAISDHQGNTRVLFTSVTPPATSLTATFEGDANDNSNVFTNVNPTYVVSFVAANHTPGGAKVVRMNQNYPVGPSKSLKVYAGDKIDLEVYAYHENGSGYGTSSTGLTAMITAIASAFGGVSGGGGESGAIYNGVSSGLTGYGLGGNPGDTQPAAYLNYILFDQNYKVVNMGWQRVPASSFFSKQLMQISNIQVKEAGYLFTYLSYEDLSNNYVQFDDLKITHTKGNVLQYNEYYPFGLNAASSWTRESVTGNNFLYDAGNEQNTLTGMYDLFFRNYDPALGRMHQVDPLADRYSSHTTYKYGFNNPMFWNDPSGAGEDQEADREMKMRKYSEDFFKSQNAEVEKVFMDEFRGPGDGMYGSMFARYGPGDGGALISDMTPVWNGSSEARENARNYSARQAQSAQNRSRTAELVNQAWRMTGDDEGGVFYVQNAQIATWATFSVSVPQDNGGTLFSDPIAAKDFIRSTMMIDERIVEAVRLQNGATFVFPTEGFRYIGSKRSKSYERNAKNWAFTEHVASRTRKGRYQLQTDNGWETPNRLILGLPELQEYKGYYKSRDRNAWGPNFDWLVPTNDMWDAGGLMGCKDILIYYPPSAHSDEELFVIRK